MIAIKITRWETHVRVQKDETNRKSDIRLHSFHISTVDLRGIIQSDSSTMTRRQTQFSEKNSFKANQYELSVFITS